MSTSFSRFSSLRLTHRLTIPLLLILIVVDTLLALVSTRSTRAAMMGLLEERAERLANTLSTTAPAQDRIDDAKSADGAIAYIHWIDPQGRALVTTETKVKGQVLLRDDFERQMGGAKALMSWRRVPSLPATYEVAAPIQLAKEHAGAIRIGMSTCQIRGRRQDEA